MMNEYFKNCASIETNDDKGFKEKTRIAEVAAATLCRLNSITKQIKDWRDDRSKLRSNIWRLKLALRVASRETDDTLHTDPVIEHQRAEIKRLEAANKELKKEITNIKSALLNDSYLTQEATWKSNEKLVEVKQEYLIEKERLNNEIQYLKSRLNEVEEGHEHSSEVEHLKCKLKHFMMVDYTMEIIFTDIVNRVAETIANLSEELVNVNERLHRSRMKNDSLYVEIDKLKATLRFRSGNLVDYQKRVVELDNLTKCLKVELKKIKTNYGDNWGSDSNFQNSLKNFERLVQNLRDKLKNDHEALLAGGDPDCLRYIQKIIDLRVNLKQLHAELAKFTDDIHFSCPEKIIECNRYMKQLSTLDLTFKEINDEIDKLKNNHVKKHYGISYTGGLEYLNKIEELETIIEKAQPTMNGLNRRAEENSNRSKDIEKLEDFVGRMCHEIKQLEVIVVSNDRSIGFKRIEQLEDSILQLKSELCEKDEHVNVLDQELCDTENLMEHRVKELDDAQKKIVIAKKENEDLKEKMKRTEERSTEIQRELENSKKEIEQLQQVKREASLTRKKLQNLQNDKEGLLKEMGKIRDALQRKNDERNTMEKTLNAKIADLTRNLQTATKENEKLQAKTSELERIRYKRETTNLERDNESMKRSRETAEKMNAELQQLKVNLAISKESLDNANREIADLKVKLERFSEEKTKLQGDVFHLESKRAMLEFQLEAEKATAEGRLKEITKLQSDYNELNVTMANLKKEKEHLNVNLTSLRIEKDALEKSLKHVHDKCSALDEEIDRYKAEREGLIEEVRNFRTSNESLSDKLEKIQTDLGGAGDKIKQQEVENSKLRDDLNRLTLKNASLEGRLQVILSEKNELTTRINELNEETVAVKDQLNEVKKANECSNVELSNLKMEYNKSRSEYNNILSQLDEARQSNETLKEANEDLKLRANEIHSECRVLGNQLKILEGMNAILRKEKRLLEQECVNSLRSKVPKVEKNGTVVSNESNFSNEHTETKQTKSGKRANDKAKNTEATKKLMVENESLRFEILNLKSQNFEAKMQLTRMKDELQRQRDELEQRISETAIKPIPNKLEIVNLYYKEINSYSGHGLGNMSAVTRFGQSSMHPYDDSTIEQENVTEMENLLEIMNKLKVENVALKMEVNSLRCNLVVNFTEDEKRRNEIRIAAEEIQALKAELTKLRDEKESLRVRLDTAGTKLDRLESEKAALKDELYSLRKINADLKHKASEFRNDYQKLKEKSVGFEGCIVRAIKKIKKYTMNADNRTSPDDELKVLLKKYISNEEILHSIELGINLDET